MGQERVIHLRIEIAKTHGFTQVQPPKGKDLRPAFACIDLGGDYNGGGLKRWA
jgi:hypothetical protein